MGRNTQSVEVPGEPSARTGEDVDASASQDAAPDDVAALRAQLATKEAENAELKAKAALPQVVYEPVTPHGAAAMAASAVSEMTVAQVMAEIDAGRLKEPITSYLCSNGYYARRA